MPQAIAPLIAGITGLAATSTAVTLASSVVFYAGATAASYLIQQANQPKQDIGTKLSAVSGGTVPQSIIIGRKATAGSLIYVGTWGRSGKTPNSYYVRVFSLQDMPSSDIETGAWPDSKPADIDFDTVNYTDVEDDYPASGSGYSGSGQVIGNPVRHFDHDGNHYVWAKFLKGEQVAADPYLLAKFGMLADRPWSSDMIGRGRTLMIVTQRFTTEEEGNSEVSFLPVVKGIPLYDWRKDSTNGGVGSHRWTDASTHEYSANPIVALYNVMRGIRYNGKRMYGGYNWPSRRFDNDTWTAAAHTCDENVTLKNGDNQKRYRMGAEINLTEAPLSVMDRILATCAGKLVKTGGIYKVYAGGIGASVFSFTDDDIIISEQVVDNVFPTRDGIVNTITPVYTEPSNGWQDKTARKRTKQEYIDADRGEERNRDMQLEYVLENQQAQRVGAQALKDNRRFRTFNLALSSVGRKLEPIDTASWSSEKYQFSNKKFILGDVQLDRRGLTFLTIREADPTDADWSPDDEDPFTAGVYGNIAPGAHKLNITAVTHTIRNNAGKAKKPAIKVTWNKTVDDADWKRVSVWIRLADTHEIVDRMTVDADDEEIIFVKGIVRAENYEASGLIIPYSSRLTERSDWEPVTASNVKMDDDDVDLPIMRAQIAAQIDEAVANVDVDTSGLSAELQAQAAAIAAQVAALTSETTARVTDAIAQAQNLRGLIDRVEGIADYTIEGLFKSYANIEQLRQTITAAQNSDRASFDQRIIAAVNDNAAAVARVTTLEASTALTSAQIVTVDLARAAGDEALATQIQSLSAGTQVQFDHAAIWYFDSGVEGWTGNGSPSASGSFLRPADDATDPYVISPFGLAVAGAAYGQVRARIKKTGVPAWQGYVWWKATGDTTWDSARRVTVAEPNYDAEGYALITANTSWTGTIDQIRLDLTTTQTGTDYDLIDWVAIGRPAPGASSADLAAEKSARITADSATASDVLSLQARMASAETGVNANTSGVSGLTASVATINGTLTTQGSRIDGLESEVDGKADNTAVDGLQTQIDDFGGSDGIRSTSEAIRALRNIVDPLADLAAESAFAAYLRDNNVRQAIADVNQVLSTRIDVTATSIDVISQAVTTVQAALPGLASANGLSALTGRVTATEASIVSLSSFTTSLSTTVAGKADGAALSSLTSRVEVTEAGIYSINSQLISLTSSISGKADSSVVSALTNRVTSAEGTLTAQGSAITSINNALPGKASTTALAVLSGRVDETEDGITTLAQAITQVTAAATSGDTATARVRMSAVTTPSGWQARYAIQVRGSNGADFVSAGLFMDVKSDGTSRIVLDTDKFVIRNGSNTKAAFKYIDGVLYLDEANIGRVNIDDLAINGAKLNTDAVTTGKIANDAITAKDSITGINQNYSSGGQPDPDSLTITNANRSPVFIWVDVDLNAHLQMTGSSSIEGTFSAVTQLIKDPNGSPYVLWSDSVTLRAPGGAVADRTSSTKVLVADMNPGGDSVVYRLKTTFNYDGGNPDGFARGSLRFGYTKK